MKQVPLAEIKDDFSRYLREASKEEVVITRHGKPAGVLVGFASEEDWLDHALENDPEFLSRIEKARADLHQGLGMTLDDYKARQTTFVGIGDAKIAFDDHGLAVVTQGNVRAITTMILQRLRSRLANHEIVDSYKMDSFKSENTIGMPGIKIRRVRASFKNDMENALSETVNFLVKNAPKNPEKLALEVAYRDDQAINNSPWRDFGFFAARWVRLN